LILNHQYLKWSFVKYVNLICSISGYKWSSGSGEDFYMTPPYFCDYNSSLKRTYTFHWTLKFPSFINTLLLLNMSISTHKNKRPRGHIAHLSHIG
jgi:hypothetical protein